MTSIGLVPAPKAGNQNHFLTSNGQWKVQNSTDLFLCADGNWKKARLAGKFLCGNGKWESMNVVGIPETEDEFQHLTWPEIAVLSEQIVKEPNKYQHIVGWQKNAEMSDGYGSVPWRCVAINHDYGGTKHGSVWQSDIAFSSYPMNETSGEVTYGTATMQNVLSTLHSSFPEDLKSVLKFAKFKYTTGQTSYSESATQNLSMSAPLFLPAINELVPNGVNKQVYLEEGEPFDHYLNNTTNSFRIRKNSMGSVCNYWTRSVNSGTTTPSYKYITVTGYFSSGTATASQSISPCFVL